jgi:ComF family protein
VPTVGRVARQIQEQARRLPTAALDLLFPPRCVGCGQLGTVLCDTCVQQFEPVGRNVCPRCGRPGNSTTLCNHCRRHPPRFRAARSAFLFADPLQDAVHALKYQGESRLAGPLAGAMQTVISPPEALDGVVPVPLHTSHLAERGYNQAALLAEPLASAWGLPMIEAALARIRQTRSQVGLSLDERRSNVGGAFVADPQVAGSRLLLVDDVCTTGATLDACAAALLEAGARAVWGVTLARAI